MSSHEGLREACSQYTHLTLLRAPRSRNYDASSSWLRCENHRSFYILLILLWLPHLPCSHASCKIHSQLSYFLTRSCSFCLKATSIQVFCMISCRDLKALWVPELLASTQPVERDAFSIAEELSDKGVLVDCVLDGETTLNLAVRSKTLKNGGVVAG